MYLKKLEISGFKSFASTTTLEFNPPRDGRFSVTAIVGPNGSGKSNIADAIRWVLGEQSLKQLRGKKSEDVIFGGSEGKGKLSLASVSMILDNRDHRAPIDYEELIITRRVYRTGESDYLINGNTVRLIDLQLLLAQAQFGHGSYGVIGQGTIDRLLLQSAAERKNFFDEAVGIKEFQLKRHQAWLKLNRTEENITQAERLLQEVEPHLKTLRRQVKKLQERQEIELTLTDLAEQYYATLHHTLTESITACDGQMRTIEVDYTRKHTELTHIQTELATLAQEASRQDQFQVLQDEYQKAMQTKNDYEREQSVLAGKLQTEYSKVGKHNVGWLENKVVELKRHQADSEKEIMSLRDRLIRVKQERQNLQTAVHDLEKKKIALETQRLTIEKKMFDSRVAEQELPAGGLRSAEAILKSKNSFGGMVYGLVAQLGSVDDTMKLALEVAAGSHLSSMVVHDDSVAERAIRYLKDNQLGVATFLPLNKIRPRPVSGDIDRFLHSPGVYGLAVDLVKYNPEFTDIFSYVFGSTLVVDSINTARTIGIGRVRMVTADGDLMETSGSMKGGFRRRTPLGLHFSSATSTTLIAASTEDYQKELGRIEQDRHEIENRHRVETERLLGVQTEENTLTQKVSLLADRERELAKEISGLEQELSLYSLNPEEYGVMMLELAREKDSIHKKISSAEHTLEGLAGKLAEFNASEEQKRQRIFALQDAMQSTQEELNKIATEKNNIQLELVKLQTRCEDLENEIFAELKEQPGLLRQKITDFLSAEKLEATKAEIEKLKYKLSLIGGIDDEVMREYEETQGKYDHLTTELTDLKKAAEDITELIAELDAIMKKKHAAAFAKIKKEFSRYFSILFEGGKAELVEVYGTEDEDEKTELVLSSPLEVGEAVAVSQVDDEAAAPKRKRQEILTGIEVTACPPGKKIKNIAALSGGERTLTSIALVCAILHTNPPPFVLLDEVEAALDEANTVRLNKILHELSSQSQFLLITHNRATMHAADVLYGVTMGNDGVSKLLSVKLQEAGAMAE